MSETDHDSVLVENWTTSYNWDSPTGKTLTSRDLVRKIVRFLEIDRTKRFENLNDGITGYGSLVRAFRLSRSLGTVDMAREARVHPVALALLERGALLDQEVSREFVERIESSILRQKLMLFQN